MSRTCMKRTSKSESRGRVPLNGFADWRDGLQVAEQITASRLQGEHVDA